MLPRVVHQIMQCKDDIAQQYLMQCLIQVRHTVCVCLLTHQIVLLECA